MLGHKLILFVLSSNFKEGIKGGCWCSIIKFGVAVCTTATTPQNIIHCRNEKMEFQRKHNKVNGCSRSLKILLNKTGKIHAYSCFKWEIETFNAMSSCIHTSI